MEIKTVTAEEALKDIEEFARKQLTGLLITTDWDLQLTVYCITANLYRADI